MSLFSIENNALPKPVYEYIVTEERATQAIEEISKYNSIEVDTETTGLDPYTSRVSLLQIGIPGKSYVFDVRHDTEHSSIHLNQFKHLLTDINTKKILQNAVFDMKMIKLHGGYYLNNIYDTMIVEQLFNSGITMKGSSLTDLIQKYLGLEINKEPRGTFQNFNQKFEPFQIEYAAGDVSVLTLIKDMQQPRIVKEGFENVSRLEFEFTKAMCEMELNGITLDIPKWKVILDDTQLESAETSSKLMKMLAKTHGQNVMFGVPVINVDSNQQLLKALNGCGLKLTSTNVKTLEKYRDVPVVKEILTYRKLNKFVSTYGDSLLEKINPVTGRLHTNFQQIVSTGRMSSSAPNLQNIPKKQKYRSCFIAKEGYDLITADMANAELRILTNLSMDPVFLECYDTGIDIHTKTASEVFDVPMSEVTSTQRNGAKSLNFGICYGLSKYGLSARLDISEQAADNMITTYFEKYPGIKKFLDGSARHAVKHGYTATVSGRKRFYNVPPYEHPERKTIQRSVERAAKNACIQGGNADTIKESMIYVVDRLDKSGLDANLILTVHDEIIIESRKDHTQEAIKIVEQSLIDGFGRYFSRVPMETDGLIGPCWLKSSCKNVVDGKKCKSGVMKFMPDEKYGTKLVCDKCESAQ